MHSPVEFPTSRNKLHMERNGLRRKCAAYKPPSIDPILLFGSAECRNSVKWSLRLPKVVEKLPLITELQSKGFVASTHTILSKDGYYTTSTRISGSESSPPKRGKPAVLLFHGMGSRGESWTIQPGNRNLAFMLINAGYEVWLANLRGSTPSQNHTHLNYKRNLLFWNFSFEEQGTLDLPPLVDLILKETDTEKIYFVCHSSGCSSYLAGLAEIPELNKKFKAGFLLAPSSFLGSAYGPAAKLRVLSGTSWEQILFVLLRGRRNGGQSDLAKALGFPGMETICSISALQCGLCDRFIFAMFGADVKQLNFTNIPNMIAKSQDNTVWKSLVHTGQNLMSCGFNKFDYGSRRNLVEYGSQYPPKYDLEKVAVPTYIFYGESDNLITPWDAERTKQAIPSKYMKGFYRVDWPLFNHIDFLMANDADILVYKKILTIMDELEIKNGK
ncbi:Lipase 3 [Orchesella cincta]|uniref:Lipase 3 n=1 Tax=Orchesella cincta TaxID=48709 RepID=A0A1D2MGN1_ORCCI|nr:Lipase 3 [Orchesella cincta]